MRKVLLFFFWAIFNQFPSGTPTSLTFCSFRNYPLLLCFDMRYITPFGPVVCCSHTGGRTKIALSVFCGTIILMQQHELYPNGTTGNTGACLLARYLVGILSVDETTIVIMLSRPDELSRQST
ncbi:hypothetical protein F5Y11DRAFT_320827 [Daldinia sp. FL1419]|nr:hypothetical protein F5Y11DRAFT_320827 [Daldinia sp. FL1419]